MQYFEMALELLKGTDGVDDSIWLPWEPTIFNLAHCYRKLGYLYLAVNLLVYSNFNQSQKL